MEKIKAHSEGFQIFVGLAGAALQLGLMISDYVEADDVFFGPIYLCFALALLLSARYAFLGPVQAALFFAVSGLQTVDTLNSFYGLGFAVVAALVLFRQGSFATRPTAKAVLLSAVGAGLFALPVLLIGKPGLGLAPAGISVGIYIFIVFGLAKGGEMSALAPRKMVLKLSDYKLSPREVGIVKARLGGRSVKELASDFGLAESTVRNAMSAAYHKLNVEGSEGLVALGERYRVE